MSRSLLRPAGFVIAGLLFLAPFVTVSCDVPGGFGRAAPGATSTYTGVDLVVGGEPRIEPRDKVRDGEPMRLDPQPLAMLAVILILAGVVVSLAVRDPLRRSAAASVIAGGAAVFLVTNQLTVNSLLRARLPSGKDYLHNESGFWLCLITLTLTMAVNSIGWLRAATHR